MFSHANLAIFTKNGTLLPLNPKAEILVVINDDYEGQAVFYPITGEDDNGVYFRRNEKIYGGKFSEEQTERILEASSQKIKELYNEERTLKIINSF